KSIGRAILTAASLVFSVAHHADAQGREIRVHSYNALLTVNRDGTLDVVEQLTIRFTGQWQGLNRHLPLRHNTAQARPPKLAVVDGPITDAAGQPLVVEHKSLDAGWTRRYHIYIPGAYNADRTIIIHYRVRNAIRFFLA